MKHEKEYIGSQEHYEDEINEYYYRKELDEKRINRQIEQQIYEQQQNESTES